MTQDFKLAQGRDYLAIPGPSVIPDAVLRAMHRASPNIYEGALVEMTHSLIPDLRRVARTEGEVAIYISNGHGAWEAALANVIAPGEQVLALATGSFGQGWADMARGLGAGVQVLDFGNQSGWHADRVFEVLKADSAHRIKAVLAVQVDTSSSLRNDVQALRAALDQAGHPALLMVDCIASLGCDRFEMDAWGVDVMVAACQKGLMVPAGVAFVFFNEKASAARVGMARVSRYWDWTSRAKPQLFYQFFGGTAPTHHLYGLRAALDMIHQEGMEAVWKRHAVLARAIWAACDAWGRDGKLTLNVPDPAQRSHAVTSLRLGGPDGTRLRKWVEQNLGLTLGIGLGLAEYGTPEWDGNFRLGHMGHVNGHMVLGLLGGIEAGMTALDIPHGAGAVDAAARVIAGV